LQLPIDALRIVLRKKACTVPPIEPDAESAKRFSDDIMFDVWEPITMPLDQFDSKAS